MGSIFKPLGKNSGGAEIFRAIEKGDIETLKSLVPQKSELLEIRNKYGWTPLHHAVMFNQKEIVEYLVSIGANIFSKDSDGGEMPLNFAVRKDYDEIAQILISKGADYMGRGEHTLPPLHIAAIMNSIKSAKLIISLGADVNKEFKVSLYQPVPNGNGNGEGQENSTPSLPSRGLTPLHLAIYNGNEEIAKMLIFNGASVNTRDSGDDTPLHKAVEISSPQMVQALITAGADVNAKDQHSLTPLHRAAASGNKETIEILLNEGADIDSTTDDGMTPLFYTAMSPENYEAARFLIEKGASVDITDNEGATLRQNFIVMECYKMLGLIPGSRIPSKNIFDEIILGNTEQVESLIEENREIVNEANPAGFTPLHFASMTGDSRMVKLLLYHGANLHLLTKNGQSPLHRVQNAVTGEILLSAGAKVKSDEPGFSPILLPIKPIEVMELLIEKGADVNERDASGLSPLITAAMTKNIKAVEFLMSKGANPEEKFIMGGTVLHWAFFNGHEDIAEVLLNNGASAQSINQTKETPLHVAANHGLVESVKLLIEKGADIKACDIEGKTPLHFAALAMGNPDKDKKEKIIKILTDAGADLNAKDSYRMTPLDYCRL